jgi:hypothetical protein
VSSLSPTVSLRLALDALRGVGDPTLGEWRQVGDRSPRIVHVRRRLSREEAAQIPGGLRDIRGTPEQAQRITALLKDAPYLARAVAQLYDG